MTEFSQHVAAGASLEGAQLSCDTASQRADAIEAAFDYRGDVTVITRDGRTLTGFIFDRRAADDDPTLRLMPADGGSVLVLRYAEVAALHFTGRDTAAGKSWETWVRKYQEKKARGEKADRVPDPLE